MPNIIDTRDLNKRLEELEDEFEGLTDDKIYAQQALDECEDEEEQEDLTDALNEATAALEDWEEENLEELNELLQLADEIPEWRHGETLINDDYFVEYAIDFAGDLCGAQLQNWPFDCIDWDRAADALKMDYSSCEYQGNTYWFRE